MREDHHHRRDRPSWLAEWLQRRGPRTPARQPREEGRPRAKTWLEVMLSGQNTRDPSLKTRRELARDCARASALQERRQSLRAGASKPAVPKPAVPKPAVPKPAVPKPAVPKPVVPKPGKPGRR